MDKLIEIASKLRQLSTLNRPSVLVNAVVSGGRLLLEARRLGAFDPIEWVEISPCLDEGEAQLGHDALKAGRHIFGCSMRRILTYRPQLAAEVGIYEMPVSNQAYDWDWVRACLSATATLVEMEARRLGERNKSPQGETKNNTAARRKWTQQLVDSAIRNRAKNLVAEIRSVEAALKTGNDSPLRSKARRLFGRNEISRELGCPPAMVSRSTAWRSIAVRLHLIRSASAPRPIQKMGEEMGVEAASEAEWRELVKAQAADAEEDNRKLKRRLRN